MHKLTKEQEERFDNEFGVKYTTSYFKNLAAQIKSFLASELAAQRESIAKEVDGAKYRGCKTHAFIYHSMCDECLDSITFHGGIIEAARIIRNNTEEK